MNILNQDFKQGKAKLKVTDREDLWYLSHLIDPGDFVKGKTTRKIKVGAEDKKVAKKTFTLKIEVKSVDISEDNASLRVNGLVKEGPEEIPKNVYHSISLEEGSEFTLEKVQWLEHQKRKLTEAAETRLDYLLCLFDREEALIALTKKSGYEILLKIKGEVPKKRKTDVSTKDFYLEIIHALDIYLGRLNPEKIILASPAFYKEDLMKRISSPELKKKIVLATCSDIGESSLDEVIKSPELKEVLKSSRAREEKMLVDELLQEINRDNLAAYGWKEVKEAAEAGAVSRLLLTDRFVREKHTHYEELDRLMKLVDGLKGGINILSSKEESGKKIDGLGGIAAILRYKLRQG